MGSPKMDTPKWTPQNGGVQKRGPKRVLKRDIADSLISRTDPNRIGNVYIADSIVKSSPGSYPCLVQNGPLGAIGHDSCGEEHICISLSVHIGHSREHM